MSATARQLFILVSSTDLGWGCIDWSLDARILASRLIAGTY